MANLKSEQITSGLDLIIDEDQPLSQKQINEVLINCLGTSDCSFVDGKVCYKNKVVFLTKAVTYLGGNGQHPIFKKRIQLPNSWKEFCFSHNNYDVRFLGIYHYNGNIVFVDFDKDTYINRKMNNSSAFVYINDLYKAMQEGVFERLDVKGNTRHTIKYTKFKDYINGTFTISVLDRTPLHAFKVFNSKYFTFNKYINIVDALRTMYQTKDFKRLRQTEWPGWYLENRVENFIIDFKYDDVMKFVGSSNKKKNDLDFDIWFVSEQHYGDLKASDLSKKETPGNDSDSFFESLNKFGKFWYIVYEHNTEKETDELEASKLREDYLKSINEWKEPRKHKREYAFHRPLKLNVDFKSMMIIELNRVNCHEALSVYNQGVQPDGGKRNTKVKINKNNIDNFIIYSYRPQ